jgi:hypothetical protein
VAIVVVQAFSFTSDASSANVSVNATATNAIIVGFSVYTGNTNGSVAAVTRTGDTYTTDTQGGFSGGANRNYTAIASAPNVAGGAVTLSATAVNSQATDGWAVEVSGLPSASIRDANSPAVAQGTGTTTTANSLTNATADAIFFNQIANSTAANPATLTAPGTYTTSSGAVTTKRTNGSVDQVCALGWRIVSSTGAETPAWTTTTGDWTSAIAVYKASAAATMPPGLGPVVQMKTPMMMPPP